MACAAACAAAGCALSRRVRAGRHTLRRVWHVSDVRRARRHGVDVRVSCGARARAARRRVGQKGQTLGRLENNVHSVPASAPLCAACRVSDSTPNTPVPCWRQAKPCCCVAARRHTQGVSPAPLTHTVQRRRADHIDVWARRTLHTQTRPSRPMTNLNPVDLSNRGTGKSKGTANPGSRTMNPNQGS
jgi:hypothetical protein